MSQSLWRRCTRLFWDWMLGCDIIVVRCIIYEYDARKCVANYGTQSNSEIQIKLRTCGLLPGKRVSTCDFPPDEKIKTKNIGGLQNVIMMDLHIKIKLRTINILFGEKNNSSIALRVLRWRWKPFDAAVLLHSTQGARGLCSLPRCMPKMYLFLSRKRE